MTAYYVNYQPAVGVTAYADTKLVIANEDGSRPQAAWSDKIHSIIHLEAIMVGAGDHQTQMRILRELQSINCTNFDQLMDDIQQIVDRICSSRKLWRMQLELTIILLIGFSRKCGMFVLIEIDIYETGFNINTVIDSDDFLMPMYRSEEPGILLRRLQQAGTAMDDQVREVFALMAVEEMSKLGVVTIGGNITRTMLYKNAIGEIQHFSKIIPSF